MSRDRLSDWFCDHLRTNHEVWGSQNWSLPIPAEKLCVSISFELFDVTCTSHVQTNGQHKLQISRLIKFSSVSKLSSLILDDVIGGLGGGGVPGARRRQNFFWNRSCNFGKRFDFLQDLAVFSSEIQTKNMSFVFKILFFKKHHNQFWHSKAIFEPTIGLKKLAKLWSGGVNEHRMWESVWLSETPPYLLVPLGGGAQTSDRPVQGGFFQELFFHGNQLTTTIFENPRISDFLKSLKLTNYVHFLAFPLT